MMARDSGHRLNCIIIPRESLVLGEACKHRLYQIPDVQRSLCHDRCDTKVLRSNDV